MSLNNKFLNKSLKLLDNYYYIFLGLILIAFTAFYVSVYSPAQFSLFYLICISFSTFTVTKEIRRDVSWFSYFLFSLPVLVVIGFISIYGYDIWSKILQWQLTKGIVIDLNTLFKNIPFNDASFARVYKNQYLTEYFRLIYNTGFVFSVTLPIYRSVISKDLGKVLHYSLSAHVFQVLMISPFYRIFHLQEVWYVLNQTDGLARVFKTPQEAAGWVINCFPSMHTSIAFAMFLLVLRERDKLFKIFWSIYCLSIIYSTMYLEIHWVIDVLAGLVLGYAAVKLADFVISKGKVHFQKHFGRFYYNEDFASDIKNNYIQTML